MKKYLLAACVSMLVQPALSETFKCEVTFRNSSGHSFEGRIFQQKNYISKTYPIETDFDVRPLTLDIDVPEKNLIFRLTMDKHVDGAQGRGIGEYIYTLTIEGIDKNAPKDFLTLPLFSANSEIFVNKLEDVANSSILTSGVGNLNGESIVYAALCRSAR